MLMADGLALTPQIKRFDKTRSLFFILFFIDFLQANVFGPLKVTRPIKNWGAIVTHP